MERLLFAVINTDLILTLSHDCIVNLLHILRPKNRILPIFPGLREHREKRGDMP